VIPTYAVVPSYGRECLRGCLNSLIGQVDLLFLIQTKAFPIPPHPKLVCLPWDNGRELNISEWWNMGIKAAAVTAQAGSCPEWNVLVANDDIIAPLDLAASLSKVLRAEQADLAYLRRPVAGPAPLPPHEGPITGWCFMLRGESGIVADPQFCWWWGDIDIELQARHRNGVAIAEDCQVRHLHPGGHDRYMGPRISVDCERFREKWKI